MLNCKCNHVIHQDDIDYSNYSNEEGEEYYKIYYRCPNCDMELEFNDWGWIDYHEEAIDAVHYKIYEYD